MSRRLAAAWPVLVVVLCAVTPRPVAADDLQLWVTTAVQLPVEAPWRVTLEVQPRWTEDVSRFNRLVVRGLAGRALGRHVTLLAAYEQTAGREPLARDERRLWQQLQVAQPFGRWSLQHRARLDERFIEDADGVSMRARYQARVTRTITERWSVFASDEVFFTLNDAAQGPPRGFDQHRYGGGVATRVNGRLVVETAYQRQDLRPVGGTPRRQNHIVQVQVQTRW